jgi:predicted TIM-barrel fold metal-dependent hydrolase
VRAVTLVRVDERHEIERPSYIKDAPPRIFDTHIHFPFRRPSPGLPVTSSWESMIDMLAYHCQRLNILRVCLLGRPGKDNDLVEQAARRYPGLFLPFAMIDTEAETPDGVHQYADRGFRGLKIINPRRNYDHPAYFPLYAAAQERNLVILFHTGIVGGPVDYLQYPPRDESHVPEMTREMERHRRWSPEAGEVDSWYGASRMQPIFLDGIGVAFPDLKIIGAHMGYGLYDSAAAVARWRRNVYFDISGGTVVRRHLLERNMLRGEVSTKKLTFGTDCDIAHMSREVTAWMQAFAEIGLSEQEQDDVFWGTAARLFGETV